MQDPFPTNPNAVSPTRLSIMQAGERLVKAHYQRAELENIVADRKRKLDMIEDHIKLTNYKEWIAQKNEEQRRLFVQTRTSQDANHLQLCLELWEAEAGLRMVTSHIASDRAWLQTCLLVAQIPREPYYPMPPDLDVLTSVFRKTNTFIKEYHSPFESIIRPDISERVPTASVFDEVDLDTLNDEIWGPKGGTHPHEE